MSRLQTLLFLLIGTFFYAQLGFSQEIIHFNPNAKITPVNSNQKTLRHAAKDFRLKIDQKNNGGLATEKSNVVCLSVPDVTIPASICGEDEVSFTFGPGCVTDPGFDDPATGGTSGFGFVVYDDPATPGFDPIPAGAVGTDVFADPNYLFFSANVGGCTGVDFGPGFFNIVAPCEAPVALEIGVFGADVFNFEYC